MELPEALIYHYLHMVTATPYGGAVEDEPNTLADHDPHIDNMASWARARGDFDNLRLAFGWLLASPGVDTSVYSTQSATFDDAETREMLAYIYQRVWQEAPPSAPPELTFTRDVNVFDWWKSRGTSPGVASS
ncbi:MAG: hypothetical protein AAF762_12345 [Pseudomonadota bacterium]